MRKLFTPERISRLSVALLLTLGVLLPLLLLFGLEAQIFMAILGAMVFLTLLTVGDAGRPWKWLVPAIFGAVILLQLLLPGMGFLSGSVEAIKAVVLYMNGLQVVMPLFGGQVALLLTICVTACSFLFSKKEVGFLPAAIMVVLVLFGLWALGQGGLIWYTMPALCALLLLISQTAHEKISVLNVLPMALAVVLLSLLMLPAGRVAIEPLEKAAFQLKQTITDYLFFTEPRNVFTLGSYGYYPMGGSQLGGDAEPTEYPVMVVKTDRKTLLRGVVKDEYTGRSFRDTSSAKRYLYINPRWLSLREKVFMEKLPADAIRKASALLDEKAIIVEMQNRAASTVFTPLFLRSLTVHNNMVPYFNDASELFVTRDVEAGDRYTVYTPVFEGGNGGLDALVNATLKNDPYYAEIYSLYTRLPDHLEQKVYDDVANMIKDAETPYDKAMAIMRHLQKYYRYTLRPADVPDNMDFVTYFLYVSKEGYCTYYASAMTVLCRMAGLPTRYVEGFLAMPASDGLAYVTGKDAHAWTEVYFEGFGWVPFDPTPMQQGQNETPPNQEPEPEQNEPEQNEPEPTPSPEPNDEPSPEPPTPESEEDPPEEPPEQEPPPDENPFPWLILLLAAAATGGLIFVIRRRSPHPMAARQKAQQDQIFIYGSAINTILRFRKRVPKPGETPLLFAKRMDSVHVFATPITPLWRMMAMSNYSRRKPGKEQSIRAKEIFDQIYKPLPPLTKLRFLLSVVFNPKCYRSLDTAMIHEVAVSKTRLPGAASVKGKKPVKARKPTGGQRPNPPKIKKKKKRKG